MIRCGQLTRVQALHDGGGVDQVASAQWTCEVRVEVCDFNPVGLHFIHGGSGSAEESQRRQQGQTTCEVLRRRSQARDTAGSSGACGQ